jgi:hypothetical protein
VSELVKVSALVAPGELQPLVRGTLVGRFVILDFLGAGAMGVVHAAYDPHLDRRVALKLLRPEATAEELPVLRARLLREAQAMARLVHPNVVSIHDAGESGERVYLGMRLVAGRSVRAWLAETPRLPRAMLDVYAQAGRGLAAAHHLRGRCTSRFALLSVRSFTTLKLPALFPASAPLLRPLLTSRSASRRRPFRHKRDLPR